MPEVMSVGDVAKSLQDDFPEISRDKVQYAIRYCGAPEPKAGKVGNRRIFSPADVEALREWFSKNRKYESVGA